MRDEPKECLRRRLHKNAFFTNSDNDGIFLFSDVKDTPLPNPLNEIAEHIK